ncbi:uracil-DNA glycosylase [Caldimonas thermodepolymerans]|uniref:uracil-DNA glycosylase n=1 Tax=Caldimonas thermodepolymerans TaxID=215580 RepID=UPI002493117F|nr:uracil-DNA glycosylase [Caldimonas thermodepolymerans]
MDDRAREPLMNQVPKGKTFDAGCVQCPRLAAFLAEVREANPGYYARPVPSFGDPKAELLVVGLAPGMHGANRTGRPFTGDYAGILLYETLYKFGYANRVGTADPDDGLVLKGCRIANAVKCVPPQNKPNPDEIKRCNQYLAAELAACPPRAILALGRIAHDAALMALGFKPNGYRFAHHAVHDLPNGMRLYDSSHCSRYNTQTRRLTTEMFEAVFADIAAYLGR